MSAQYNIIQGPHVSEGLLSQQAQANRYLGESLGQGVEALAGRKKRLEEEKKAYQVGVEQDLQKSREEARNAPLADQNWLVGKTAEGQKRFADFHAKLDKSKWHGPESLAEYNKLMNEIADNKRSIDNYWGSYQAGKEQHAKDVNFNLNEFEKAHSENLQKTPDQRSPLDPNDPRFYNPMTTTSNHLIKYASKELQPHAYQEKSKVEPSVLNTMEQKYNPAFMEVREGKVQAKPVQAFEPLAQTMFEQHPYMGKFFDRQNVIVNGKTISIHDLATGENTSGLNPTGYKDSGLAGQLKIQAGAKLLRDQASHDYNPGYPSLKSSTHIPNPPAATAEDHENKKAEERVKRIQRETNNILNGDTKTIENINEYGKTKGFEVSVVNQVSDSAKKAYEGIGKKVGSHPTVKFTTMVDIAVEDPNQPGKTYVKKVPHEQEYDLNVPAQLQAFQEELNTHYQPLSGSVQDKVVNSLAEQKIEEPSHKTLDVNEDFAKNEAKQKSQKKSSEIVKFTVENADDEYHKLRSGDYFIDPEGVKRRKP